MQARSSGEPELLQAQRRRREQRDADRGASTTSPRRARRRRQSTPWLQRNALSVAAVSVLIAFLGLGFGLLQMLNRPDGGGAYSASQTDAAQQASASGVMQAATLGGGVPVVGPSGGDSAQGRRSIHTSAKVLEPNYT